MTDVVAANSCGVRSILVKPLVRDDAWNTTINRYFEKIVWNKLSKKNTLIYIGNRRNYGK